jgi:imidazole glycerol phosphate synthase glutamine amidotransferase subunit
MKNIGIINLDSGNLLSMKTAVESTGYNATIITKPEDCFDALILPGQGRFASIANQMDQSGWREFILNWVAQGKKLIGVCVGMQILFEFSEEDPSARGLGLLNGNVCKLNHPKTPMVGWAQLNSNQDSMNNEYAYFVNSYGIKETKNCTSKVVYGDSFCASVQKQNLYGFQFHPEKSGPFGRELIKTCLV